MSEYPLHHLSLARPQWTWRIGGICTVLATVAIWWLMIGQPRWLAQAELARQLGAAETLRAAEETVKSHLAQAQSEAEHWRGEDEIREERASLRHEDSGFLRWVNQEAEECGVAVRDYRPSGRERQGDYVGRGVMLSAHGSYPSVCRFLDRLRTCPRMNRITRLEITPRDPERTRYAFTLQVLLFSYDPAPTAAVASRG